MLVGEFHANIDIQDTVRRCAGMCLVGVRVTSVVGNVVVVTDIGTYLVLILS